MTIWEAKILIYYKPNGQKVDDNGQDLFAGAQRSLSIVCFSENTRLFGLPIFCDSGASPLGRSTSLRPSALSGQGIGNVLPITGIYIYSPISRNSAVSDARTYLRLGVQMPYVMGRMSRSSPKKKI